MKRVWLLLLIVGLTGCHEAGTWQDDPHNFVRIFNDEPPPGLVIVHSQYWRSRYLPSEFSYFMEVRPNDEFQKGLFHNNQLKQPETDKEKDGVIYFPNGKPGWFLPKLLDQYEAWIFANKAYSHFRIFIDKQTHDLFLSDYQ